MRTLSVRVLEIDDHRSRLQSTNGPLSPADVSLLADYFAQQRSDRAEHRHRIIR